MVEYHLTNGTTLMVCDASLLVAFVKLVDSIPVPAAPSRRGRPRVYSDRLFLKALVKMAVAKTRAERYDGSRQRSRPHFGGSDSALERVRKHGVVP
jgi:hypothetical protein